MTDHQEIETKFLVRDIQNIELRLINLKAGIFKPRCLENNFRFDTKENKLASESKVLRLRQDTNQWLTYKEPGDLINGVRSRHEIEFNVSDIKATQSLLEALGLHIFQTYEKFRTVYILNGIKIMLDELPIGSFIEIEGDEVQSIKKVADDLNLRWELKIDQSYLSIFNSICRLKGLGPRDLTFETIAIDFDSLNRLNIFPADQHPHFSL